MDYYILESDQMTPKAVDFQTWAKWFSNENRKLALHENDEVTVSTVFLGLDHGFGRKGPPVLWESMVFGGPKDGETKRYTSWKDAAKSHQRMVKRLLKKTVYLHPTDSLLDLIDKNSALERLRKKATKKE